MRHNSLRDRWASYREAKTNERLRKTLLGEVLERLVQESLPSIRRVGGYRQQLLKPIENAFAYMEGLVAAIPGPVTLATGRWDKDPLVHALFVGPHEIRSLLEESAELKEFFGKTKVAAAQVLLTATQKERAVFGTTIEGEIIRRDVPKTVVEFYDHRVVAPAATGEESLRELVHRGLTVVATHTLEKITEAQSLREELVSQRQLLGIKLKIKEVQDHGLRGLMAGGRLADAGSSGPPQLLAEIDQLLRELGPDAATPEGILREMKAVLNNPSGALTGKPLRMHLDGMGYRLNDEAKERVSGIDLAELEVPGRVKRVAVLATISAGECPRA
jgi:hypothetical protein